MVTLKQFYDSHFCTSRLLCKTCRDKEGGKRIREKWATMYAFDTEAECPFGKPWNGEGPVIPPRTFRTLPEVTHRNMADISIAGPSFWRMLHTQALNGLTYEWYIQFLNRLPSTCACRAEGRVPWKPEIDRFQWTYELHEHINQKLNKPGLSFERAKAWYGVAEYFDPYVISLARTPERIDAFAKRLRRVAWVFREPQVFSAIDGNSLPDVKAFGFGGAVLGCRESHLEIIRQKRADVPILLLEDDAEFSLGTMDRLAAILPNVPSDADILFLGGQHHAPVEEVSDGLVRAKEVGRTHALAVYPRFFDKFIDYVSHFQSHIDWGLRHLSNPEGTRPYSKFAGVKPFPVNFYAVSPFIAAQGANHSTIRNAHEPLRAWGGDAQRLRQPEQVPMVIIRTDRNNLEELVRRGEVHPGWWRGKDGMDNGLRKATSPVQIMNVAKFIRNEACDYDRAAVALWHPRGERFDVDLPCLEGNADHIAQKLRQERRKLEPPLTDMTVFYHVAQMGNWENVVDEQLDLLASVGINRVYCTVLGNDTTTLPEKAERRKISLTIEYQSNRLEDYEHPCLAAIHRYAMDRREPGAVLYFHTKGVSAPTDKNKVHWRKLMAKHVVRNWRNNLGLLSAADFVGVDWQESPDLPHYSGNFWMARTDWLSGLADPYAYQASRLPNSMYAGQPWKRISAEFWLGSRPHHEMISLCCKNENLWTGPRVFDFPLD